MCRKLASEADADAFRETDNLSCGWKWMSRRELAGPMTPSQETLDAKTE
jgi:hypothetical protein